MNIKLANYKYTEQIIKFYDKYLDKNNEAIHSGEFFCPFGVKLAIKRNQLIIILDENKLVSVVRFYPRKRDNIVSVYQFAVDEKYRWKKLLQKMLEFTECKEFEFVCPKNIEFNNYYRKIGANILKQDEKNNYWALKFTL